MPYSIPTTRPDRIPADRPAQPVERNAILAGMPLDDREAIGPHLSRVRLVQDQTLFEFGGPVESVYFMEHGILALNGTHSGNRTGLQIGMIGPEGMAGFSTLWVGAGSMCQVSVQMPGTALRMPAAAFRSWMDRSPAFHGACLAHLRAIMAQFAQNAVCNGEHPLLARCANWLLMTHQRSSGMDLLLTHEYLAVALGVRRSGVTAALCALRDAGAIDRSRGRIRIVDRGRLGEMSCGCLQVMGRMAVATPTERRCDAEQEPVRAIRPVGATDLPAGAHALFG